MDGQDQRSRADQNWESEARFRRAFEDTGVGMMMLELDGSFRWVNKALCEMLGYSASEILSKSFADITYPDDLRIGFDALKRMRDGETSSVNIEKRYVHKDGHPIWVELNKSVVFADDNKPVHTICHIHDISDRKRADEALRQSLARQGQSEERHRNLFEASPAAMIVSNETSGIVYANGAAVQLYGAQSLDQLIGRDTLDFVHPDDRAQITRRRREVFQGDRPPLSENTKLRFDGRRLRLDGSEFITDSRSIKIDWEGAPAILLIILDITEAVQHRHTLHQHEERFRHFFENAASGMVILDLDSRFVEANNTFCEFVGYSEDELRGKSSFDITHPDDLATSLEAKRLKIGENLPVTALEKRYVRKDGRAVWALISRNTVDGADGKPEYTIGQIVDITQQKIAEAALKSAHGELEIRIEERTRNLKEQEARYRTIVVSAADAIFVTDIDSDYTGRIVDVNKTACTNLGYSREELITMSVPDIEVGLGQAAREENYDRLEHGQVVTLHGTHRRKDGTSFPVSVRNSVVELGGAKYSVALVRDETDRKEHEKILEDAQRESALGHSRLIEATDSFAGGFALNDKDDRLVICNDNYHLAMDDVADILKPGIAFEELLRTRADRGMRRDGLQRDEKYINERLEQHRNPKGPVERTYEDGTTSQLHEFKTREGGTAIIRTDVTELKNSERALNAARQEAEAASQAKSEFLANMSHELRTPLNAIIGFSEALSHEIFGPLGNLKQEEYIDNIHTSGEHLLDLINDILEVSTIEADKLELREQDVDIEEVVNASLLLINAQAEQRSVKLVNAISGYRPIIRADQRRIKQALVNILSNAVKFSNAGGGVAVNAEAGRDGAATILITDTGIGMSEADLDQAMEPFGQVHHEGAYDSEGTGLGLPLTKRLVEIQGGRLVIDSAPQSGTTVRIEFPPARVVAQAAP